MKKCKCDFTLGAWLTEWYKVYKLPTVAKSTSENIERVIRLHIPQWLKDMPLTDLKAFTIDKALSGIKSTRMRKYAFHVLNSSLNKAYRLDYIETDIMKKAEPIKHRSKLGEALTVAEQLIIIICAISLSFTCIQVCAVLRRSHSVGQMLTSRGKHLLYEERKRFHPCAVWICSPM